MFILHIFKFCYYEQYNLHFIVLLVSNSEIYVSTKIIVKITKGIYIRLSQRTNLALNLGGLMEKQKNIVGNT